MPFLLPYAVVIGGLAGCAFYWKIILKHRIHLQGLCLGLRPARYKSGRDDSEDLPGWRSYTCDGHYRGARVRIEYRFRASVDGASGRFPRLSFRWKEDRELSVQIPIAQKFWLRLLPKRIAAGPDEEVQIGVPEFDEAYLIHSNQPEAAREFLMGRLLREQLGRLPNFDRVEFYRGWLRLQLSDAALAEFRRSDLESTIDTLSLIALDYTQRSASFKVVAVTAAAALCPYCRSEFGSSEEIFDCGACGTRLHSACREENGQCTTWGCPT